MTTLLLPPDEVARVRTLKGQVAYILAIMILLDRHHPGCAFTPKQVSLIAGMDERTADKQLRDLSTLNRVILSGSGYVLTEGGRAMFLPAGTEALALSPETSGTQAQALQTIDVIPTEPEPDNTHNVCALEEVEVNHLTLSEKDTSTTYLETQIARLKVSHIFSKSHLLFGESVVVPKGISVGPEYLLAIFAHVHALKDECGFNKPARVAFSMLRDDKKPREEFVQRYWEHLPTSFLEALELKVPVVEKVIEQDPDPELEEVEETVVDDTVNQPCPNVRTTPAQAWQSVLGQLQMDMHHAPFDTWVRDSQAVRFDGCTLFVGVRNSYTRDWLADRLQSTVERLLVGVMNQSVNVRFVVDENLPGR